MLKFSVLAKEDPSGVVQLSSLVSEPHPGGRFQTGRAVAQARASEPRDGRGLLRVVDPTEVTAARAADSCA
jgi:hypothetical protein